MSEVTCQICTAVGTAVFQDEPFDLVELGSYSLLESSAENCSRCLGFISHRTSGYEDELAPDTAIHLLAEPLPESDFQIADEGQNSLYLDIIPHAAAIR